MQTVRTGTLTLSTRRYKVRRLLTSITAVGWVRTLDDSVVLEADSPQDVSLARLPLLPKDTRENLGLCTLWR